MGLGQALKGLIRSRAAIRFTDDFKSGLGNWVLVGAQSSGWSYSSGFVQPGSLRLWKKSMTLSDYNFEFQGQIERKGLGWVYRATDEHNYYATRILITRPGPLSEADIVRYTVLEGKQQNRIRLPLPLQIRSDLAYNFRVDVSGDRFSTRVNGQVVDTWTDRHLAKGGVGFFTEDGEAATVRQVSISDRNTFTGRLFSYLQAGYVFPAPNVEK